MLDIQREILTPTARSEKSLPQLTKMPEKKPVTSVQEGRQAGNLDIEAVRRLLDEQKQSKEKNDLIVKVKAKLLQSYISSVRGSRPEKAKYDQLFHQYYLRGIKKGGLLELKATKFILWVGLFIVRFFCKLGEPENPIDKASIFYRELIEETEQDIKINLKAITAAITAVEGGLKRGQASIAGKQEKQKSITDTVKSKLFFRGRHVSQTKDFVL